MRNWLRGSSGGGAATLRAHLARESGTTPTAYRAAHHRMAEA